MKQLLEKNEKEILLEDRSILTSPLQRRSFLQFAGVSVAGIALVAAGCKKDKNDTPIQTGVTLDFKDDFGVLNYAYALEQLEAAFYIKVASAPPSAFTPAEKAYFQDIQFHEIAHREYLKKALGTAAVGSLEVDFSSINFADKASVLGAAKAFEDLGVAAYNGAGKRLTTPAYLLAAGKIVSVEARHAAYIRDLITPGSFAANDVIDANGLDKAFTPTQVLAAAGMYIKTKINVVGLTA
ncbi:ferritin-like domain-containing protein [Pedobacter psychroterrae]|uniref:Ferritin-like domain-containing protein n=1 Tax=Pedobacter psychroterrae TaxID=2530453 RepID=A0A4R0NN82_9SPHI|nr:ferritin-like domain-containing protein [Pedobacter psychroterrae]TCD01093.1 ferritin-like domain-containing protein [Pedobacter psychroterrae]